MPNDYLISIDMNRFDKSIQACINNLNSLVENVSKEIEDLIKQAVNIIAEEARENHVFTSRSGSSGLAASIHVRINKLAGDIFNAQVGSWKEYAYFVEVGTSHAKAYPYLLPAFEKKFDEVVKFITEGLKDILNQHEREFGMRSFI